MRIARSLTALALTATVAMACSDSTGPNDVTVDDLVGSWAATKLEFTSLADNTVKFDIIANGGTFTLTLQSNGSFTGTQTLGPVTEDFAGTITVSNGTLTMTDAEDPTDVTAFTITVYDGTLLTMNSSQNIEFDFDFDGVDEDASLVVTLQRQ